MTEFCCVNKTMYEIAFLLPALGFPPLKLTEGFITLVLEERENRNFSPNFSGAVAILHISILKEVEAVKRRARKAEMSSFVLLYEWG